MDRKIRGLSLRELLGFGLLILLLLIGLLLSWYLGRQQEALAASLEDSAWLALSGQWENAKASADQVRKDWERRRSLWAVFGDLTPMEEIDTLLAELTVYAAAGERTDFAAACNSLARRMAAMGNAQTLRWWNVL